MVTSLKRQIIRIYTKAVFTVYVLVLRLLVYDYTFNKITINLQYILKFIYLHLTMPWFIQKGLY